MNSTAMAGLRSRLPRTVALTAAALAMAGAGLVAGAGSASAASADITNWYTYSSPFRCTADGTTPTYWCLYYSPGAEGALFKSHEWQGVEPWLNSYTFGSDAYGSAGAGQPVVDNAASAENASSCSLAIYSGYSGTGNENWLAPGRGGNFTWWMRNQEKSGYADFC